MNLPVLLPTFTKYDKFIYALLGMVVVIGNQIIGTPELGLSPAAVHWVNIVVGAVSMFLTIAQPNKGAVFVPDGHVVVPATQVSGGVAGRQP